MAKAGARVTWLTTEAGLQTGWGGLVDVPLLLEATRHPDVQLLTGTRVQGVQHDGRRLRVTVHQAPQYVDPQRCTACGACTDVCPVSLPDAAGRLSRRAISRIGVPTTFAIDKAGTAPCREACPIDQRAQGYVALIRAGNFGAAYEAIKRENPFPSVCGRVCNHRCEEACTRAEVDEPVAVMALKRFVADWAWERRQSGQPLEVSEPAPVSAGNGYRVAIVGAGPAGLTAARELNRLGHAVTVWEALPVPGGMMRVGIPSFRLSRERLNWDIEEILAEGVRLRTNSPVKDVERLFTDGYDAVVLATGLHASRSLSIPGVEGPEMDEGDWPGVMGAVEFLRRVNLDQRPAWPLSAGRRVVVVGGGSTALDTARFCRRLGADVTVVYRRSRAEMPAHDFEVTDAQREGVALHLLANPVRVLRQEGRVVAVECVRMELGEPDESGRRRPVPIPGSEFVIEADNLLLAIGQTSDLDALPEEVSLERGGTVAHDADTLMTDRAGLFVAGDVAGSDGFVVDAIATGLRAAGSVDRYLRGAQGQPESTVQAAVRLSPEQVTQRLEWAAPPGTLRARPHSAMPADLIDNYQETELGLSQEQALAEAARCLSCGLCSECLACVQACPAGAIDHARPEEFFEFQPDAVICVPGEPGAAGWEPAPEWRGVFVASPALSISSPPGRGPESVAAGIGQGETDLAGTVDQALAYLGLVRPLVRRQRAAPVRRQLDVAPVPWNGRGSGPRLGVLLCRCGGEIARTVDLAAVAQRLRAGPSVAWVEEIDFACHESGHKAIRAALATHDLDGAVLAACSCCGLDQLCYSCTTQRTRCKERLGVWDDLPDLPLEFVNVREQCAFVHREDPAAATRKAADMVAASVARLLMPAAGLQPAGAPLPITALVDPVRCRGCDDCATICGLEAIQLSLPGVGEREGSRKDGVRLAHVDPARCLGCGVCMAVCSSGALLAGDTSDLQAEAMLAALGDLGDKTVVFSCNWGAYGAVEAAGVQHLSYDPAVRLVRLMCAGRAHEGLILRAFTQGAARVLVLACGHEEGRDHRAPASLCHYHTGNRQAAQGVAQARHLLELLGLDPARLALVELQPGDAAGFVAAVEAFTGEAVVNL
jgi:NADPH-dependent glutamate synthase beta subunit-like oxidoreductase/coenzyme F420-reducing hydrogenase delta subunit